MHPDHTVVELASGRMARHLREYVRGDFGVGVGGSVGEGNIQGLGIGIVGEVSDVGTIGWLESEYIGHKLQFNRREDGDKPTLPSAGYLGWATGGSGTGGQTSGPLTTSQR